MENPRTAELMTLERAMEEIAPTLEHLLLELTGERVAFILLLHAGGQAQCAMNTGREDSIGLLRAAIEEVEGGAADVPASCDQGRH